LTILIRMAARRKVEVETEPSMVYQQPMSESRGFLEKMSPVLMVLVVVMAFALGSLWSKVKYLEGSPESGGRVVAGDTSVGQPQAGAEAVRPSSKFKDFGEALGTYAAKVGLDANKLLACVNNEEKAGVVEANYQEGVKAGVSGTPGFFVNGKFLGGAFPIDAFKELIDKELAGTGSTDYKTYKNQALVQAGAQGIFDPTPQTVSMEGAMMRGASAAKVTLVEFSDFQCPYCKVGYTTVKQLEKDYEGRIKFVFMNFPLRQIHPNAQKAAEAFECAREQGNDKAWALHDVMFDSQSEWSPAASI